jgi:hypothetical protein
LERLRPGFWPYAGLLMDKAGNLYGTTRDGGGIVGGYGVVFKLTPTAKGDWKESVIHAFPTPRYHDGELVMTGLIADPAGNFYGAAYVSGGKQEPDCGDFDGCGVVFKLSPNSNGTWSETILHAFQVAATEPSWSTTAWSSMAAAISSAQPPEAGSEAAWWFEIKP